MRLFLPFCCLLSLLALTTAGKKLKKLEFEHRHRISTVRAAVDFYVKSDWLFVWDKLASGLAQDKDCNLKS